jgi:WD40 repeat protein
MHFDLIKDTSTDATGRLVLTCSTDKTARLWRMDLPADGATAEAAVLLKTLCPPLSEGEEGMLFSNTPVAHTLKKMFCRGKSVDLESFRTTSRLAC